MASNLKKTDKPKSEPTINPASDTAIIAPEELADVVELPAQDTAIAGIEEGLKQADNLLDLLDIAARVSKGIEEYAESKFQALIDKYAVNWPIHDKREEFVSNLGRMNNAINYMKSFSVTQAVEKAEKESSKNKLPKSDF